MTSGLEDTLREACDRFGIPGAESGLATIVREYLTSDEAIERAGRAWWGDVGGPLHPGARDLLLMAFRAALGDEPFCEIDADELEAAKRDPVVRDFAERADEAVRQMREDEA
jgi:hypothetical protein